LVFGQKFAHDFIKLGLFNCESDGHPLFDERDAHDDLNDDLKKIIKKSIKSYPDDKDKPETKYQVCNAEIDSKK